MIRPAQCLHHDLIQLMLVVLAAALTLDAQADVPRLANGKPDLNGTWQALNRANFDLLSHAARPAMAMREGPFKPVPAKEVLALGAVGAVPAGHGIVVGDEIPYQDWARQQQAENQTNWLTGDPEIKCYLPGVPRANYMPYPFQIFHSDSAVFFAYEYAGATRNILLTDPGEPPVDSWMGQSVGRWEGDTFVIEVSGFNGQAWLDRAGNFHSNQLKVTERFTRDSAHTMRYHATLVDPTVYTRPWEIEMTLYRLVGKDAPLHQFKCVEFVEELIYGDLRKEPLERIDAANTKRP